MNVHIALYRWKVGTTEAETTEVLGAIRALANKIPGVIDITTGGNTSAYGAGYTHAILVRLENQTAIDDYRAHPDHRSAADKIEAMEDQGIGVDFLAR